MQYGSSCVERSRYIGGGRADPLRKAGCIKMKFAGCRGPDLQPRQVRPHKGIPENVPDRGKDIRGGGTRNISCEWNQGAELVARDVLEESGSASHQRLPEELRHRILADILRETEDFEIPE